jgi:hypothetical protein
MHCCVGYRSGSVPLCGIFWLWHGNRPSPSKINRIIGIYEMDVVCQEKNLTLPGSYIILLFVPKSVLYLTMYSLGGYYGIR